MCKNIPETEIEKENLIVMNTKKLNHQTKALFALILAGGGIFSSEFFNSLCCRRLVVFRQYWSD